MTEQKTTRRGFLGMLGKGSIAGAAMAVPAASVMGAERREDLAFNFVCMCDRSLITKVPKAEGDVVNLECDCGRHWRMRWDGDHFQSSCDSAGFYGNRRQEVKQ